MRSSQDSTLAERVAGNFQRSASAARSRKHTLQAEPPMQGWLDTKASSYGKSHSSTSSKITPAWWPRGRKGDALIFSRSLFQYMFPTMLLSILQTDISSLSLVDLGYVAIFHLFLRDCLPLPPYSISQIHSPVESVIPMMIGI